MILLGMDCGIASIGWSLIETDFEKNGRVVAMGSRMFDAPETDKERRPKNELRRIFRGQRRVISRRAKRMSRIKRLFFQHGLLPDNKAASLKRPHLDPWKLRSEGLDRLLSGEELAVALGHIARHRGFRSNAKTASNQPDDESVMKKAIIDTQSKLSRWRTIGEMLACDPEFAGRKRNRQGDYSRTPFRSDLEAEVRLLFNEQRRLQNPIANYELEAEFASLAFAQKGLADSESKVGFCAFEQTERRAAKRGYSYELFRYLSRLTTLRIGVEQKPLSAEDMRRATAKFGTTKKISFSALRKLIGLPKDALFVGVKPDEENRDVVARHGEAAAGTGALFNILQGAAWESLIRTPDKLDRIAEIISFRSDLDRIRTGFLELDLDSLIIEQLVAAAKSGHFEHFSGAGHISAKACRNIIPYLVQGLSYDKACEMFRYDHTANRERNAFNVGVHGKQALEQIIKRQIIDQSLVGSPVARKALLEAVKQVKAIVEIYGVPAQINVELARDVGKSIEERQDIESGIDRRNKIKDKLREKFVELLPGPPPSNAELFRYELWLEQNGRCLYSDALGHDGYIDPRHLRIDGAFGREVEIDHILPWSRFNDDSYHNKTLCFAGMNQKKKRCTPFEWFVDNEKAWSLFTANVQSLPALKRHKRKLYLLKDAKAIEDKFSTRNLNDTRWASRLLLEALKSMYPKDGNEYVFARPGAITDRLRRAWGLQGLKKNELGLRIPDDRHHALDAAIVAVTTNGQLQRLTGLFKKAEENGDHRDFRAFKPPWETFRDDIIKTIDTVFVSRAERNRARGKAHDATVKQIREINGKKVVFERKAIEKLTNDDLENIPIPKPHGKVTDPKKLRDEMVVTLRAWIAAQKPKDKLPLSPKGDVIRKVRLATTGKIGLEVYSGPKESTPPSAVDRTSMPRVDIFRQKNKRGIWEFYAVPIYPYQIAQSATPPNKAIKGGGGDEDDWFEMGEDAEFLWSLYSMSLVQVVKADGKEIEGYFRSLDRNTGAITISLHSNSTEIRKGIGIKTLRSFRKFTIDRVGRKFEIMREVRTWRGEACT
jgi:CRISPR-associated endonuclease Csn1